MEVLEEVQSITTVRKVFSQLTAHPFHTPQSLENVIHVSFDSYLLMSDIF